MRVLRFALLAAFLPVLICAQVPALWAQTLVSAAPAGDGSDRINIAGRQRMLTQRMAKSICFVLLDVDKVVQRVTAENAALEFDKKLAALQFGSREHALSAESDPEAKRALAQVAETSRTLTISVRQLAAGDLNSAAVRLVIDLNLPTLTQMNEAVGLIERVVRQNGGSGAVGSTINKAGRQRMLSQRIAKDACFIAAGLNPERSRVDLEQSVALFEKTLEGLLQGDPETGILPPPNSQIEAQLRTVQQGWQQMVPLVGRIGAGQEVTPDDLSKLVAGMDVVLVEMNRAVDMWVQVGS